jgi:L-threonylcarbamoyladenylate synthase
VQIFDSLSEPGLNQSLLNGKVGIIPTDTVYGIVALASERAAVSRLYQLKSRRHKPGTVIAYDIEQLIALGVTRRYLKAVEHFWPGPISVVIPLSEALDYLDLNAKAIPFRLPSDPELRLLLKRTGPLLTTSANPSGEPPAATTSEAKRYFNNEVDFYVEGEDLSDKKPSTIIKIIDDAIDVVRQGEVKVDEQGRIG